MPGRMVWLWNHITGEWEEAPAVVTTVRMPGAGLVAAGAHKLYWMKCNPSAGNSNWELCDSLVIDPVTVLDEFHTEKEGHTDNFLPPMQFNVGIFLKMFTNMNSITFGYI